MRKINSKTQNENEIDNRYDIVFVVSMYISHLNLFIVFYVSYKLVFD